MHDRITSLSAQGKLINRTIKKYHTIGTTTQSNVQILKRGEIDTPYTQIHNCGFSLLSTGTSIKSCGVEMALWTETSPLSVIAWHYLFYYYTPLITHLRKKEKIFENIISINFRGHKAKTS
jgi:hypothetical protein